MSVPINRFVTEFFRIGGDIELNVDGALTPVDAVVEVPEGFTFHIHSFTLVFSADKFEADGFGPLKAGLTVGLCTTYQRPGEPEFLLPVGLFGDIPPGPIAAAEYIRKIWQYAPFFGANVSHDVLGKYVVAQWAAAELCSGRPVEAPAGTILRHKIADDLTVLKAFRMTVAGILFADDDDPGEFLHEVRAR